MILADLFHVNQYGTRARVIDALGREITRFGVEYTFNNMSLPEDLVVVKNARGSYHINALNIDVFIHYLVPCNIENIFLYMALSKQIGEGFLREHPYVDYIYFNGLMRHASRFPGHPIIRILDDGTGWLGLPRSQDTEHAEFYMVDIPYRLDLQ